MKKLIISLSFVIIVSCDDSANDTATGSVIMPLKVGNYWTFVDSTFDDLGNFVEADTSTLGITGKKTIEYEEQSYEVYLWTWLDMPEGFSWLVWNGPGGLYMFGGSSPKQDYILTKSLSIKFPVDAGDSWNEFNVSFTTGDSSFFIRDTSTTSCISTSSSFVSPLGDLECYVFQYSEDFGKILMRNPADQSDFRDLRFGKSRAITHVNLYYKPDVGYVGLTDETNAIITFKKTIIDYLAEK